MRIEVIGTAQQCDTVDFKGKTAVVIDVLRATSVIVTALFHGAKAIIPAISIEEAQAIYKSLEPGSAYLCGERNANIIPGFHYGNSPLAFSPDAVIGKTLVLTTTNGTLALRNTLEAAQTLTASFLNISAVAELVGSQESDLVIVCAGTGGRFSLDDALCTGMLISLINEHKKTETDDLGRLVLQFFGADIGSISDKLAECSHVKILQEKGFQHDIDFCLQTSRFPIVPILKENYLVKS
ncbi:MAG: 2-phosphosulfolactate phosphatase [Bacteroidales bacterium]|nr:2-phosphosulfolactate phosphatase [Bacteroidales bacterium]